MGNSTRIAKRRVKMSITRRSIIEEVTYDDEPIGTAVPILEHRWVQWTTVQECAIHDAKYTHVSSVVFSDGVGFRTGLLYTKQTPPSAMFPLGSARWPDPLEPCFVELVRPTRPFREDFMNRLMKTLWDDWGRNFTTYETPLDLVKGMYIGGEENMLHRNSSYSPGRPATPAERLRVIVSRLDTRLKSLNINWVP